MIALTVLITVHWDYSTTHIESRILVNCLLKRLVVDTDGFLSDWQADFRAHRGCRDNILLLRVLYDNVIKKKTSCVVTYIDFTSAFDSTSHTGKYLDGALKRAGTSRKSMTLFRVIYEAAAGTARVLGINGDHNKYSHTFEIERGAVVLYKVVYSAPFSLC